MLKKDQESREEQIKIVRPGLSIIKRGSRQPLSYFLSVVLLNLFNIYRINSFFAFCQLKGNLIILLYFINKS